MATCYITEFSKVGSSAGHGIMIAQMPAIASQTVAIGAEAKSSAFNAATKFIRVHVDAICSILIDSTPTAATTDARMAAGATEYFGVTPGHKISVVSNT